MRIIGGADAGVIVALAEWLFGIPVAIFNQENNLLYTSCIEVEGAKLQLLYSRSENSTRQEGLALVSRSYFLRDVTELIATSRFDSQGATRRDYSLSVIGGRLDWNTCLSTAYDPGKSSSTIFPVFFRF